MEFLRKELLRSFVQVVGRCRIDYEGRANSTLELGERLAFFKPDGTLIVHTGSGLKPVNWQPPGASFQADVEESSLVVTSTRTRPKELVRLRFESVDLIASFRLRDASDLEITGTEDDLQEYLARNPDAVEPGFRMIRREKRSARGPMDIYAEDSRGRRVIVEVKRGAAGLKEVEQLRRYVERERAARSVDVRGILVAASVSPKARRFLEDLKLEWKELAWRDLLGKRGSARPAGQAPLWAFQVDAKEATYAKAPDRRRKPRASE
ncbi:MAG: endonuclease NucS [Euryarchaeota archaeon]|nr:endonuclease NucS [Euryarchaeota archaeon]